MGTPFRNSAGFGKRMEYWLLGRMLMEGLDCYVPLVDDHGVDCVVRREDGVFLEVQIKARSREAAPGDGALFSAISHSPRPNFFFVFYAERLGPQGTMWVLSSEEFLRECSTNRTGGNIGKHSIWFNGFRKDPRTGLRTEYCLPRFKQYVAADFSRLH